MDDLQAGRAIRELRRRLGWRHVDLAIAAAISQSAVSRAELGELSGMRWGDIRRLFGALGAGCTLTPWWRSGAIDRLLDEDHAMLVARAEAYLRGHGWVVEAEVSFAVYGERGSIDLLATRPAERAIIVVEVKSRLMSIEELLRTLDRKVRLAPKIVEGRLGWRPRSVGRLVVLAEDTTNRRRVSRAEILTVALAMRAGPLHAWLRAPEGAAAGLLFLPLAQGVGDRRRIAARQRVRTATSRTNRVVSRAATGLVVTEDPPGG